jgi:hypothetical protein
MQMAVHGHTVSVGAASKLLDIFLGPQNKGGGESQEIVSLWGPVLRAGGGGCFLRSCPSSCLTLHTGFGGPVIFLEKTFKTAALCIF